MYYEIGVWCVNNNEKFKGVWYGFLELLIGLREEEKWSF